MTEEKCRFAILATRGETCRGMHRWYGHFIAAAGKLAEVELDNCRDTSESTLMDDIPGRGIWICEGTVVQWEGDDSEPRWMDVAWRRPTAVETWRIFHGLDPFAS